METIPQLPAWIPVSTALPKPFQTVLFANRAWDEPIMIGYRAGKTWLTPCSVRDVKPTHWRPLPELPHAESLSQEQIGGNSHVAEASSQAENVIASPAPGQKPDAGKIANPFTCTWDPTLQDCVVEDRLRRVEGFGISECEAALKMTDLQKTVRLAVERRLRKLQKQAGGKKP